VELIIIFWLAGVRMCSLRCSVANVAFEFIVLKRCVETCFGFLNGLIGYDQHADWMMKPISNLDRAVSETLPILALISQVNLNFGCFCIIV
jgi:hypothetical protein